MKGKLKNGFKWDVDEKVLDDMELVDAVAESEENPAMVSKVVLKLLGKSQRDALYDYVRTDDGRVPVDDVTDCVMAIIEALGDPGKNS